MRELPSEVAGTSISGRDRVPRYRDSLIWLPAYRLKHPPQRAVAQRLCALAQMSRVDPGSGRQASGVKQPCRKQARMAKFDPCQKLDLDVRADRLAGLPAHR